jgi:Kef-type K+ transport system membrane component KefB
MVYCARRPLLRIERVYREKGELSENWRAIVLLALLAAALATHALGLHLLFGALIAGAVMPRNQAFADHRIAGFESLTVVLLLPLFFAYTGLRTNISHLKGSQMWLPCLAILAAAVLGKLGGTSLGARLAGIEWQESLALGALMNTLGLMELVVLNIGARRRSNLAQAVCHDGRDGHSRYYDDRSA